MARQNPNAVKRRKGKRVKRKTKTKYKSKQSAINSGKNFMRFRNEKPVVKGSKILNSKK